MSTRNPVLYLLFAFALFGCATSKPPAIFVPQDSREAAYYYRNGVPIVATTVDSFFVSFVVEPSVVLGSKRYVRVWVLFKNDSRSGVLLDPLKFFRLTPVEGKHSLAGATPESPSEILARISIEAAINIMMQSIGGAMKALSTQPTTIRSSSGERYQFNDRQEKIDNANEKAGAAIANTAILYQNFASSVSSGILRRNTLFPNESVNGYIYFPFPRPSLYYGDYLDLSKYQLRLEIVTPTATKAITLVQVEGE